MAAAQVEQRRRFDTAAVEHLRAARVEAAAGRDVDGETETSASVYGLRGSRMTSSALPSSMIRPRYITAIRSAITQASERSWVMKR
jgi:hypothetical protein